MKVLELFAGTRSIGKAFEAHGHQVFSVEWDKSFENIDLYEDVLKVTPEEIVKRFGRPDVIWASPDCTTYSIAAISHHRKRGGGAELGRRFRVCEAPGIWLPRPLRPWTLGREVVRLPAEGPARGNVRPFPDSWSLHPGTGRQRHEAHPERAPSAPLRTGTEEAWLHEVFQIERRPGDEPLGVFSFFRTSRV